MKAVKFVPLAFLLFAAATLQTASAQEASLGDNAQITGEGLGQLAFMVIPLPGVPCFSPVFLPNPAPSVPLSSTGQLGGRVFLDINANGVFDGGDSKLAGWKVRIRMKNFPWSSHYTTTDSEGFFASGMIPAPKQYVITAHPPAPIPFFSGYGKKKATSIPMLSSIVDIPVPAIAPVGPPIG